MNSHQAPEARTVLESTVKAMQNSPLGTVAITGANGQVGRALLERLCALRVRTVALTRTPAELPATEMIRGTLDSYKALFALRRADAIVHLAGTLRPAGRDSYWTANGETADALAFALKPSFARRVLFVSYVGACEKSHNLFLRLKARAERVLRETGKDLVVFRCSHIIGSPDSPGSTARSLQARRGRAAIVLGSGRQRVAPVFTGDVVSALIAALTRGAPGLYDLTGPERMTMDELVRLVNRNPNVPLRHVPDGLARFLGRIAPRLSGPFVDVFLRDSLGDPSRAIETFDLNLTSVRSVWQECVAPGKPAVNVSEGSSTPRSDISLASGRGPAGM